MEIRKYLEADWDKIWPMIEKVFRAGETYSFSPDITEEEGYKAWIELPRETYVAFNKAGVIRGTYYIKPNQPGLGAHVCNCGYIVSESARGQGVASSMCEHSHGNQKNYWSVYTCSMEKISGYLAKHPEMKHGKGCLNFRKKDEVDVESMKQVIREALNRK